MRHDRHLEEPPEHPDDCGCRECRPVTKIGDVRIANRTDLITGSSTLTPIADESTALRDDSPPTVGAYFAQVLGRPLSDPQTPKRSKPPVSSPFHPQFHIE